MIARILKALGLCVEVERTIYSPVDRPVLVEPCNEEELSYWASLADIYKTREFRWFLTQIENELVDAVSQGGSSLEHKSGALYGVRLVQRKIYMASLTYRTKKAEREVLNDDN